MQVKVTHPDSTKAVITVIATEAELRAIKEQVIGGFQVSVKVPGFRDGKVPLTVLEKHIDANQLQTEFLEQALQQLYSQAVLSKKLRPVDRPNITLKKFVPFTALEFEATVDIVGDFKMADYKTIRVAKKPVAISDGEIAEVIKSLQERFAEKKDTSRAARNGDQIWIDFKGTDANDKPVKGAEGKNYPLVLGSKKFIPGFEENLLGLKANDDKTFTLKFPADYGVSALANKKVTFTVNVTKVQEVLSPKADDLFAAKIGPFKTVAELKEDIKKQLTIERQQEAEREYESEIITAISAKSSMQIPKALIDDQMERLEQDERQNLTYRGQTWEEHLTEEGVSAEEHKEKKRPEAEARLKASLVLAEVAEAEELHVMPEELEIRMQALKSQYKDPQMQAELDKPESRRDIAGRLLTEKTLQRLKEYASQSKT